jgi:hypothetical protein
VSSLELVPAESLIVMRIFRDTGELVPVVVDYKVKTTPLTQFKANHDFQPSVYLAGRWLEANPAAQFCFVQIAKPGIS